MAAKKTPVNSMTRKWVESFGWFLGTTEMVIPGTHIKRDLFKWIDAIAIPGPNAQPLVGQSMRMLGIQATSDEGGNHSGVRVRKIANDEEIKGLMLSWLRGGGDLAVVAWRKLQGKWVPKIIQITETHECFVGARQGQLPI